MRVHSTLCPNNGFYGIAVPFAVGQGLENDNVAVVCFCSDDVCKLGHGDSERKGISVKQQTHEVLLLQMTNKLAVVI